jgi:hypothetical protein
VGAREGSHVSWELGGELAFEQIESHLRLQGVTRFAALSHRCEVYPST